MLDIVLVVSTLAALAASAWALMEAVRASAWCWLISMVVLWPVGVLAWFVAGRRFYPPPMPRGEPGVE
jgi:hypothetical protein